MSKWLILGAFLLAANPLSAQNPPATPLLPKEAFQQADAEATWGEHFDGATLKGWQPGGEVTIKDGLLVVGGARKGTLHLKVPLGEQFKILMECRYEGPTPPYLELETRGFLSGGKTASTLHGPRAVWMDLLLVGTTRDGRVTMTEYYRTRDKEPTGAFTYGGLGAPSVRLEVPAGVTLTIRKIRLQTAPPAGLGRVFMALGGLMAALTLLAVIGWFLRRRRRHATTASTRQLPAS